MMRGPVIVLVLIAIPALADEVIDLESRSTDEIRKGLHDAAKIDGNHGITENELKKQFGLPDRISIDSAWTGRVSYIYELNQNRKLEVDLFNKQVVQGVVKANDGKSYLLWK